MEDEVTIGQRLRESRREAGMTQVELAELAHLTERSIQAYESDEVVPYRKMEDLAAILNKSVAWLLHGDKAEQTPGDLAPLLEAILERVDTIAKSLNGKPKAKATSKTKTKTKAKTASRPRKRS
jgi:transcriptional regulator with XRE-family HTH domain